MPLYGQGWQATLEGVTRLTEERAPVDLCGLSLGALAALHVTATRPGAVRRLVVCAGFESLPPRLRLQVRAIALAARAMPGAVLQRQLAAEVPEPHRTVALQEIAPLGRRQLARLMSDAARFRIDASRLSVPTLVLWGAGDRANAGLGARLAAALPNGTSRELRGAGHVANLDNPVAFTEALGDFLA